MKIEVIVPDELLTTRPEPKPEDLRRQILLSTLGSLYQSGDISGGLAAQVMGCSRWQFYQLLSDSGFAVIDYPEEELEREGEVSAVWYEQGKTR